jgi:hypothetical protein
LERLLSSKGEVRRKERRISEEDIKVRERR